MTQVERLKVKIERLRKAGDEMAYIIGPAFKGTNARDRWLRAKGTRQRKNTKANG
jgi:hypothetical protein